MKQRCFPCCYFGLRGLLFIKLGINPSFFISMKCRNLSNELSRFLQYLVLLYTNKKGDNRLLKKLNKKEIDRFVKKFEIKCSSITLENIQEDYFIIIDELIRFQIHDHNLIKEYV